MTILPGRLHTSIRLTVVAVFLLATILTGALATGLQYYFGHAMARETATKLYTAASSSIAAELSNIGNVNDNILELLAHNPTLATADDPRAQLELFVGVLEKNPLYYGIYLGHSDDSFFEVINLDNSSHARKILKAIPSDRWLLVTVNRTVNGTRRDFQYLDEQLQVRVSRSEDTDFEVTSRPWYIAALESSAPTTTEPYLFAQLGVPGQTLSQRIPGTNTVVGIDMTMSTIAEFLQASAIAGESDIYLFDAGGEVIASSLPDPLSQQPPAPELALTELERAYIRDLPVLTVSNEMDWPPFDFAQSGLPRGYSVDLVTMLAAMTGLEFRFINGYSWPELVEQYRRGEIDILQSIMPSAYNESLGLMGSSYASLPFALATREGAPTYTSLAQLAGKSLAIPAGWSIIPLLRSNFPDITVVETTSTLHALELVNAKAVDAALDNEIILLYIARHYFLDGIRYYPKPDMGDLEVPDTLHILTPGDKPQLRVIMDKAIAAISADQRAYLTKTWLSFEQSTAPVLSATVPDEAMLKIAQDQGQHGRLIESERDKQNWLLYVAPTSNTRDQRKLLYVGIRAPLQQVVSPFLKKVQLSIAITAGFLLALLPLSWIFANPIVHPIRQLAVENDKVRRREYNQVIRVPSRVKELDELSESMVAMVEAIRAHEVAQRKLMDSFIELIAQAIDDKSAYTGGHCERVPELALMLAEQASSSTLPAFKDFSLTTEDQWREYRIAAWLHDCGKITTPEHIVDKGSKLETIYNRIHEVRMRFEVLWRDAEIEFLKTIEKDPSDQDSLQQLLQANRQQLLDDFNFVAKCNVGGEFLGDEDQARLHRIAGKTWLRHFDDRVGLSPTEEMRLPTKTAERPTVEQILNDKPEHIIRRTGSTDYPAQFGINMEVPENLSNLGELYNLSISRGTLTAEDRFRINEHMISTIKMLESLPFPAELKNVPRYASTHHETMKGSGYPRKLPGEQLSIPERILAVADIFEALTASDRPYKKAKPVSVALDILHQMALDNHVDRDCFELFVREKVYLRYAREFLDPGQLDDVDEGRYLAGV